MTHMITPDEALFDDIVALIDSNSSFTPRPSISNPEVLNTVGFTQGMGSTSPSIGSGDCSKKLDTRANRRELEKNRQRRHRQRLKQSRVELQRQIHELSRQLVLLGEKSIALASCLWVSEAAQERSRRTQSEAEQQRLVAAVNHQDSYIKGLRQVIGKRLHNRAAQPGEEAVRVAYFNHSRIMQAMTSSLYITDMRQLEDCYARVDNVMNSCGMITLSETTMNTTHRRVSDGEVAYYQHVHKVTIPYSYDQVCTAVCKAEYEQEEQACEHYEMASAKDIAIKSRIRAISVGSMMQRYISRIYNEEDRLVRVWKMSTEGEGAFSGLHAEDSGWMCIRPTSIGVMLEVCIQQVPMRFKVTHNQEPATSKFHNMLHECLETDKAEMELLLEKFLLDDVLAGIEW